MSCVLFGRIAPLQLNDTRKLPVADLLQIGKRLLQAFDLVGQFFALRLSRLQFGLHGRDTSVEFCFQRTTAPQIGPQLVKLFRLFDQGVDQIGLAPGDFRDDRIEYLEFGIDVRIAAATHRPRR